MGMYTEFIFGCELRKDTPRECIEALDYVINGEDKKPKYENPQNYEEKEFNENYIERTLSEEEIKTFINKYDLERLFWSSSYYFGAANPVQRFYYDNTSRAYHISTRADLKNGGHIEDFIDYIKPYVKSASGYPHHIFAYVHYEEDPFPTMYGMDGVYYMMEPKVEEEVRLKEKRRWETLGDLFTKIAPEYQIDKEECTKHNKKPEEVKYEDTWVWMVEHIMEKFKDQADMYKKGYEEAERKTLQHLMGTLDSLKFFEKEGKEWDMDKDEFREYFKTFI